MKALGEKLKQNNRECVSKNSPEMSQLAQAKLSDMNYKIWTWDERSIEPQDLKNLVLLLYREQPNNQPKLPKCREDVHDDVKTSQNENMLTVNNQDNNIVLFIFSTKIFNV